MAQLVEYELTGYAGWSDYDGPSDNNIRPQSFVVSDNISKDMLRESIEKEYFKKRNVRMVCLSLKEIRIFPI
jgi:hypothetical protein